MIDKPGDLYVILSHRQHIKILDGINQNIGFQTCKNIKDIRILPVSNDNNYLTTGHFSNIISFMGSIYSIHRHQPYQINKTHPCSLEKVVRLPGPPVIDLLLIDRRSTPMIQQ